MKLLLNDGRIDLNKADNYTQTPLSYACYNGQVEVAQSIMMSGREVDLNAKNKFGKTPIRIAREREKEEEKRNWESEDDFEKRRRNWTIIIELLERI